MFSNRLPKDIVPINMYEPNAFLELNPYLADHLATFVKYATSLKPVTISELVMIKPLRKELIPKNVKVYTFGTFRSHYWAILRTAEVFEQFYWEAGILPSITPITRTEWALQSEKGGTVYKRVKKNGVLIYSGELKQDDLR